MQAMTCKPIVDSKLSIPAIISAFSRNLLSVDINFLTMTHRQTSGLAKLPQFNWLTRFYSKSI